MRNYGRHDACKCSIFSTTTSTVKTPFDLTAKDNVPEAKLSETISLASGASYTITIEEVTKMVAGKKLRMFAYNESFDQH